MEKGTGSRNSESFHFEPTSIILSLIQAFAKHKTPDTPTALSPAHSEQDNPFLPQEPITGQLLTDTGAQITIITSKMSTS